jgi:transcriptional regulator with XRE-family HTH domain
MQKILQKIIFDEFDGNKTAFAKSLGMSLSALAAYLDGRRRITAKFLVKVKNAGYDVDKYSLSEDNIGLINIDLTKLPIDKLLDFANYLRKKASEAEEIYWSAKGKIKETSNFEFTEDTFVPGVKSNEDLKKINESRKPKPKIHA